MTVTTITGSEYTLYSTTDLAKATSGASYPGQLAAGQETLPRWAAVASVGLPSGVIRFSYLTARTSATVTAIRLSSAAPAAAATPTLVRFGLYAVAGNGDLTLLSASTSDTSTFAAITTAYTRTLAASQAVTAGATYAVAALVITGVAAPSVAGSSGSLAVTEASMDATLAKSVSGQTDLQPTYAAGVLSNSSAVMYAVLV